jgi:hypothetical protein
MRYNPATAQNEKGVVENLPAVWINDERLDYAQWLDMQGPGVLLKDGILTLENENLRTRIDWSREVPVITHEPFTE